MENIKKFLTIRYLVGLSLIAASLLFTHWVRREHMRSEVRYAELINRSGKQRMLSQRIPLLAQQVFHGNANAEQRDAQENALIAGIAEMAESHRVLTAPSKLRSKSVSVVYFGPKKLNAQQIDFLEAAREFVAIGLQKSPTSKAVQESILLQLRAIGNESFLKHLNEAVSAFEKEAVRQKDMAHTLEVWLLTLSLLFLVLEALFIFRPMVKQVSLTTEKLDRSNGELLEFSYRISHDLKAPITSSQGLIKILEEEAHEGGDREAIRYCTSLLGKNMNKLKLLIEDILTLNQVSHTSAVKEETSVREVSESCISLLEGYKVDYDVDVQWDVGDEKILVVKHFLVQSLQNLLSNAIKYSDRQKEKSWIKISSKISNKICTVSVEDNGIGIDKNSQKKVFGMFQRFHPKVSEGSGLGLYLVKKNMIALGGDITYHPLEQGSRFDLTFPV